MVNAVNFDYRSFDPRGEESLLLRAITGTGVLTRGSRGDYVTWPVVGGRCLRERSGEPGRQYDG